MTWPSGSLLRLLGCMALAALVYRSAPPPDALRTGLALFVLIGGLWMTQALHLSVTALLVPLLAVLAGLMDLRTALASFAHPIIFLFLGGFALAGIGFADWMRFGVPLVLLLLPLMVGVLFLLLRPSFAGRCLPPAEPSPSMPWTCSRRLTLLIFGLTAAGWIGAAPLSRALGITADIDSAVALVAIVALVAGGAIEWPDIESRTQWGVLLLFGGGLALREVMGVSGASRFLAGASRCQRPAPSCCRWPHRRTRSSSPPNRCRRPP